MPDEVIKSYEVAKTTEASLQAALNEQEQAALQIHKIAVPYNVLQRNVDVDRALYDSVLSRMKEPGSVGGIGIVIAFDLTNSSIRTVNQLETVLGLPVLTTVPESKGKCLTRDSALTGAPGSHEAEAFRSLRASLSLIGGEESVKTILLTSASSGEGKTYCASTMR
ncbi:MAG TPA: hypothetical protein VE641_00150 [Chthoniobacterales bacterium]|nr:hypothetical protein [Chthoniobacterales bacterium]